MSLTPAELSGELVWDEEKQALRLVQARKPRVESGERLGGTPKKREACPCYICGKQPAAILMASSVPTCMTCHERWRRRE